MDQLEETGDFTGQDTLSLGKGALCLVLTLSLVPDRMELTFLYDVRLFEKFVDKYLPICRGSTPFRISVQRLMLDLQRY